MKCASVYRRIGGWYLHADSQTTDGVWVTAAPRIKLAIDVTPDALGEAVTESLSGSKQGVPHPAQEEWGKAFEPILGLAGVKTWAAFAKHARSVSIHVDPSGEWLNIEPWENAGPKTGFIPMSGVSARVRADAPPEEIGVAIEKAIKLCVPRYE